MEAVLAEEEGQGQSCWLGIGLHWGRALAGPDLMKFVVPLLYEIPLPLEV